MGREKIILNHLLVMKKILIAVVFLFQIFFCFSCKAKSSETSILQKVYSGYFDTISYVTLEYEVKLVDDKVVQNDLEMIEDILFHLECIFAPEQTSPLRKRNVLETELMRLNQNAYLEPFKLSQELQEVITASLRLANTSRGGYDPTIGPLTSVWNISNQVEYCQYSTNCGIIPDHVELEYAKSKVNYEKVSFENVSFEDKSFEDKSFEDKSFEDKSFEDSSSISFDEEGMKLDLGSIAKGYAADCIYSFLKDKGYYTMISINLGGNLFLHGTSKTYGDIYPEIQSPFSTGSLVKIKVKNQSIVTSGTYQRYLLVDGIKYHHLINPKTGYPFSTELVSVSIIGPSSLWCDGIATALFSMSIKDGFAFAKQNYPDYSIIEITEDKKIYYSKGLTIEPLQNLWNYEIIQKEV